MDEIWRVHVECSDYIFEYALKWKPLWGTPWPVILRLPPMELMSAGPSHPPICLFRCLFLPFLSLPLSISLSLTPLSLDLPPHCLSLSPSLPLTSLGWHGTLKRRTAECPSLLPSLFILSGADRRSALQTNHPLCETDLIIGWQRELRRAGRGQNECSAIQRPGASAYADFYLYCSVYFYIRENTQAVQMCSSSTIWSSIWFVSLFFFHLAIGCGQPKEYAIIVQFVSASIHFLWHYFYVIKPYNIL